MNKKYALKTFLVLAVVTAIIAIQPSSSEKNRKPTSKEESIKEKLKELVLLAHSKDELLKRLSEESDFKKLFENGTLLYASESEDEEFVSPGSPKYIGTHNDLYIAFKKYDDGKVQFIDYSTPNKAEFYLVSEEGGSLSFNDNQGDCRSCHAGKLRWASYDKWRGTYDSESDYRKTRDELGIEEVFFDTLIKLGASPIEFTDKVFSTLIKVLSNKLKTLNQKDFIKLTRKVLQCDDNFEKLKDTERMLVIQRHILKNHERNIHKTIQTHQLNFPKDGELSYWKDEPKDSKYEEEGNAVLDTFLLNLLEKHSSVDLKRISFLRKDSYGFAAPGRSLLEAFLPMMRTKAYTKTQKLFQNEIFRALHPLHSFFSTSSNIAKEEFFAWYDRMESVYNLPKRLNPQEMSKAFLNKHPLPQKQIDAACEELATLNF